MAEELGVGRLAGGKDNHEVSTSLGQLQSRGKLEAESSVAEEFGVGRLAGGQDDHEVQLVG